MTRGRFSSHDGRVRAPRGDVSTSAPAGFGEHNDGAGAALEGSLDGTDGDGLCGVTGQMGGAAQLLKHLPVKHGRLGFTGDLLTWRKENTRDDCRAAAPECSDYGR